MEYTASDYWLAADRLAHTTGDFEVDPTASVEIQRGDGALVRGWIFVANADCQRAGQDDCARCGRGSDPLVPGTDLCGPCADEVGDPTDGHVCYDHAVYVETGGAIGHGWECGLCGSFLQAG